MKRKKDSVSFQVCIHWVQGSRTGDWSQWDLRVCDPCRRHKDFAGRKKTEHCLRLREGKGVGHIDFCRGPESGVGETQAS